MRLEKQNAAQMQSFSFKQLPREFYRKVYLRHQINGRTTGGGFTPGGGGGGGGRDLEHSTSGKYLHVCISSSPLPHTVMSSKPLWLFNLFISTLKEGGEGGSVPKAVTRIV